jgi:hypothetical protein
MLAGWRHQYRPRKILAQVAMKFLVPVARVSLDDRLRMAAIFAQHQCDTRQAGELYAAWRDGCATTRKRILEHPELFFKARREPEASNIPAALLSDLYMAAAIIQRVHRRLSKTHSMRSSSWRPDKRMSCAKSLHYSE